MASHGPSGYDQGDGRTDESFRNTWMTPDRSNHWLQNRSASGDVYDSTYDCRAAAGENVHGEADFVELVVTLTALG